MLALEGSDDLVLDSFLQSYDGRHVSKWCQGPPDVHSCSRAAVGLLSNLQNARLLSPDIKFPRGLVPSFLMRAGFVRFTRVNIVFVLLTISIRTSFFVLFGICRGMSLRFVELVMYLVVGAMSWRFCVFVYCLCQAASRTSSPAVVASASARSFCDAGSQSDLASGDVVPSPDCRGELEAGVSDLCCSRRMFASWRSSLPSWVLGFVLSPFDSFV